MGLMLVLLIHCVISITENALFGSQQKNHCEKCPWAWVLQGYNCPLIPAPLVFVLMYIVESFRHYSIWYVWSVGENFSGFDSREHKFNYYLSARGTTILEFILLRFLWLVSYFFCFKFQFDGRHIIFCLIDWFFCAAYWFKYTIFGIGRALKNSCLWP